MPSLRRVRAILFSSLILAACTPAAPPPVDERADAGTAVAVDDVEARSPAPAPTLAPTPVWPKCEAQVAEVPTALFSERLLIRPPIGVEVVEVMPALARSTAATRSACDAMVTQMMIGFLADDPGKPLTTIRDEIVAAMGLSPGALTWDEVEHAANRLAGATSLANSPEAPPSRGWFVLVRGSGLVGWVLLEASAEDYVVLAPSFAASGGSLLIVPGG